MNSRRSEQGSSYIGLMIMKHPWRAVRSGLHHDSTPDCGSPTRRSACTDTVNHNKLCSGEFVSACEMAMMTVCAEEMLPSKLTKFGRRKRKRQSPTISLPHVLVLDLSAELLSLFKVRDDESVYTIPEISGERLPPGHAKMLLPCLSRR